MNVRFIDTSIMLNLLEVPGRCNDKECVKEEWIKVLNDNDILIMPLATIIETGNHIAHITNGSSRRTVALKFKEFLIKTAESKAPWTLYGTNLSQKDLMFLADNIEMHAMEKIGIGDMTIICAYKNYKDTQPAIGTIMIWSTDKHFAEYKEENVSMKRRKNK